MMPRTAWETLMSRYVGEALTRAAHAPSDAEAERWKRVARALDMERRS